MSFCACLSFGNMRSSVSIHVVACSRSLLFVLVEWSKYLLGFEPGSHASQVGFQLCVDLRMTLNF